MFYVNKTKNSKLLHVIQTNCGSDRTVRTISKQKGKTRRNIKKSARQKSRHQLRTNCLPNIFKPVTKSIATSDNALTSVKLKAVYLLEIDAT
jgi:hypothetical protein